MSGRRTADVTDSRAIHDTYCRLDHSGPRTWHALYRLLLDPSFESGRTPEQRCHSASTLTIKQAELVDTMLVMKQLQDEVKQTFKQTLFSKVPATGDVASRLNDLWEKAEKNISLPKHKNSMEEQAKGSPS